MATDEHNEAGDLRDVFAERMRKAYPGLPDTIPLPIIIAALDGTREVDLDRILGRLMTHALEVEFNSGIPEQNQSHKGAKDG